MVAIGARQYLTLRPPPRGLSTLKTWRMDPRSLLPRGISRSVAADLALHGVADLNNLAAKSLEAVSMSWISRRFEEEEETHAELSANASTVSIEFYPLRSPKALHFGSYSEGDLRQTWFVFAPIGWESELGDGLP